MYLWKIDSLVNDFKEDKVTQKEEFKYVLLYGVIFTFLTDKFLYIDNIYNIYDTIDSITMLIIIIIGTYYCYLVNSKGDNKNFMVRYVSMGIPVGIRIMLIAFPLGIIDALLFMTPEELESDSYQTTKSVVILSSLVAIAYYWYLAKKIRDISNTNI
jgi:uncharacterized membrane protein